MKSQSHRRIKQLLFLALFAAGLGFGAAQADRQYAEGCAPKAGCQFGGSRLACCVDDR
ncbi:hypothetical protein [Lysobacter sp. CA199]|uniref:hypothetical protein n=1 Tax=Lysobacter sp. CA199 TaxID=3455608 RepID=UPI003F8D0CA8